MRPYTKTVLKDYFPEAAKLVILMIAGTAVMVLVLFHMSALLGYAHAALDTVITSAMIDTIVYAVTHVTYAMLVVRLVA